jgi:hypothetical protein
MLEQVVGLMYVALVISRVVALQASRARAEVARISPEGE